MNNVVLNVFSDGASFNNGYKNPEKPQRAAYGYTICIDKKIVCQKSKDLGDNTISYAELFGALSALKRCITVIEKRKGIKFKINLYSDSQFVIKSINEWIYGWIKRDWHSNSGPVQYRELWEELLYIKENYNVNFFHVKGHLPKDKFNSLTEEQKFYHLMNEECDALAKSEIEKFKASIM